VCFGGHYYAGDDKYEYLDDTWLLDVDHVTWHKMTCTGQVPSPRYGHSAHIIGSRMFVFGGKGPRGAVYKDVYFLDLIEWVWVPVSSVSQGPSARFFHASELVGRKIVVHGGWDCDEVFGDIWIFNTDSFSWIQPRTAGFAPTPRYGHTLTLVPDGRLFIFGGCTLDKDTGVPKYNDDTRVLDTETMIWTRPRINGHTPTGRYGHTASAIGDGKIAIFGGWGRGGCQSKDAISDPRAYPMQILDTASMYWWVPQKVGKKPVRPIYNHGACRAGGSSLLLFGGFDGRQALYDFTVMNIDFGAEG
jgi:Rab9 effector protein with kelch motifs